MVQCKVNCTDKKYRVEGRSQICDVVTIELTEPLTRSIKLISDENVDIILFMTLLGL